MELSPNHRETLSELINIGYGRAAASLSQLIGQRIALEAPKVDVYLIERVREGLLTLLKGEVSSVHQVFTGAVSGHALLLMSSEAADALTSLMVQEEVSTHNRRLVRHEALTEMGNIILQGAMGVCGDLLQVRVTFSVPNLQVESLNDILDSVVVDKKELQFGLLVRTRFQLSKSEVSGYLVVVLGVTSFGTLLDQLDKWEKRQVVGEKL